MALVAAEYFPESGNTLLTIIICATVVFELGGPVLAGIALDRTNRALGE